MDDIYKNIEEHNPNKKHKILIVFDDMNADMLSNKKNFLVFITQSYFAVPKNIRLNSTHYFIVKIANEQELQSDIIIHQT